MSESTALNAQHNRIGPDTPDDSMVICPTCTSQFAAIPVDVQQQLRLAHECLTDALAEWSAKEAVFEKVYEACRHVDNARNPSSREAQSPAVVEGEATIAAGQTSPDYWLKFATHARKIWSPGEYRETDAWWRVLGQSNCIYRGETLQAALKEFWEDEIRQRDEAGNPIEDPPLSGWKNPPAELQASFQSRVWEWVGECFHRPDAKTPEQRAFRFIEEALELVQAIGTTREDVLRLVDYTYSRPAGSDAQEIGGVMVTLAALASSRGLDVNVMAEGELARCIANTESIRAKDLAKPERSPLPGPTSTSGTGQSDCRSCTCSETCERKGRPFPDDCSRRCKLLPYVQAHPKSRAAGWRCFHCGELFVVEIDARNHFGGTQGAETACRIKQAGEFALLNALRDAEEALASRASDDSAVLRAMYAMQADHATETRRAEEKGFARGVADVKAHPESVGLRRADGDAA